MPHPAGRIQYGVPTPKSKAAFSAAEARDVAKNFGTLPLSASSMFPRLTLPTGNTQVPTSSSSKLKSSLEVEERVTSTARTVSKEVSKWSTREQLSLCPWHSLCSTLPD